MERKGSFFPKFGWGWITGSLERRLSGALLLIVLCTLSLPVISQERYFTLQDEGEVLRVASSNAEHAGELLGSVGDFRLASHLYLAPGSSAATEDDLTNAAIRIGERVNALRLNGATFYDLPHDIALMDDIDQHIRHIHEAARGGPFPPSEVAQHNARLSALAQAINDKFDEERDRAYVQLTESTRQWQMLIGIVATVTAILAVVILLDLLRNILPALRSMHRMLRRLSDGDLDFEIEDFALEELRALSGPLETFRRNALAVQNLAFTDPSTGLPNRRAFMERAGALLAAGGEERKGGFAILVADVDRFKHVNDDYGHAAGDRLVKMVGERMVETLGEDAIVARVGGDEFAICIPLEGAESAFTTGSQLVSAMRTPYDLGGFTVAVTISLGLVETDGGHGEDEVHALLNKADLALYASKNEGRNCATSFSAHLEEERRLDRGLEHDLVGAFERGELRMVYQPIHSTSEREDEVEALVRWQHPEMGEISPSRFIPAAERSNQMVQLGSWIIERALGDMAQWPGISMSLNLSPLQLQQDGFVGFLMRCCRKYGIASRRIILEVTETLSIERNTRALMTLNLLRNAGFRIALDDFGTGYSSLCLMKTFKFDRLKLDRSLIADLATDPTSQAVFDAAVTMALKIGAEVVAEGISEKELVEPVTSAGCTHLQGFHYSRPIEADEVEPYFASTRADACDSALGGEGRRAVA